MKPKCSSDGQVVHLKCSTTLSVIPERPAFRICARPCKDYAVVTPSSDILRIALKDGALSHQEEDKVLLQSIKQHGCISW